MELCLKEISLTFWNVKTQIIKAVLKSKLATFWRTSEFYIYIYIYHKRPKNMFLRTSKSDSITAKPSDF